MPSLTDLQPRRFEHVREEVAARHQRRLPDKVVEMKRLTVTENLHVRVPGLGILEMTDWAKTQIGSALGIKWDKWFATKHEGRVITAAEIQQELQRRFNRLPDMIRLVRARKHEETLARSDGVLEAFLGPSYEPIDDERVFSRLEAKFADRTEELKVIARPIFGEWGWGWGNDRTSHYVFITGDEVEVGELEDGEGDMHYPGFYLRNSEVGASSLTLEDFWLRLVCSNGLFGAADRSPLLRRTHRRIEDNDIDQLLRAAFDNLSDRHDASLEALLRAREEEIDDIEEVLERYLSSRGAPKVFKEHVQESWALEPFHTRFAGIQAITRAAQRVRDPDRRYDLEHLAGRFNFWRG